MPRWSPPMWTNSKITKSVVPSKRRGQRLVELKTVRTGESQFTITDPEKDPPTLYWPGRNTVHRRRAPRQRDGG